MAARITAIFEIKDKSSSPCPKEIGRGLKMEQAQTTENRILSLTSLSQGKAVLAGSRGTTSGPSYRVTVAEPWGC